MATAAEQRQAILDAVKAQTDDIVAIKDHLKELNGTVKGHSVEIAVMKSKQGEHTINWGRAVNVILAVIQACVIAMVLGK